MIDFYSTEEDLIHCGCAVLEIVEIDTDAETAAIRMPRIVNEYLERLCVLCLHGNFYRDLVDIKVTHSQYFWPTYIGACTQKSPEIISEIFRRSVQKESRIYDSLFLYLLAYGVSGKSTDEDTILPALTETDWGAATATQWRRLRLLLEAVQLGKTSWERWLNLAAVRCSFENSLQEYSLLLKDFGTKHIWPENAKFISYSDNRVVEISLNLSRIPEAQRTEVIEHQPTFIQPSLRHVYILAR